MSDSKIHILLIENNPSDVRLIGTYLEEACGKNCLFTSCDSLNKGLQELKKSKIDVIISDLSLPDSEGLDTFKRIYEHSPETPVIVLTGIDDDAIGISAMKLGAQDFLVKEIVKSKSLMRSINYSIERFKLLKELSEKTKILEAKTLDLRNEQLKLSEAQKLSHMGSWEWEMDRDIFSCSDEFCNIHGISKRELKGNYSGFLELIHPDEMEMVVSAMEYSRKSRLSFNFYHKIKRPDNTVRIIHARGGVVVDSEGKVTGMRGIVHDVTDRVHEEELEKLAIAATKSCNSVIIANKYGEIEWVNEGFTKLSGYSLDEIKNTHGEDLRKGLETGLSIHTRYFESIIKDKRPVTYESKNFTKGGKEYWVITTLTPVINNGGEVERIIAIDSDITLRKKMEEELLLANKISEHSLIKGNKTLDQLMKAKKELEETMKVKSQFLANMSHEIRTPMNAIVGFTDIILQSELSDQQKQWIEAIRISGENLLVIINDILDFSKIQSGKFVFEKIKFNLSQVISTLIELMLHKSIEKGIKLSAKIDKTIPDHLVGDPTRLNQILLNLVGNAIKFTERGEVKIAVELISETADMVKLRFSVTDTGIGISKNKLASIFQVFTQASNETTRKYGGTGLGLTIVKELIELQKGTIAVKSDVGVGSVFNFELQFNKNLNIEEDGKALDHKVLHLESNEIFNVLVVEDNLLNQMLAKKVLTDMKWKVEVADNGILALKKLRNGDFDVVLMDIQLPEMDGYEATRNIRRKFPAPKCEIPIIALTAHALTGEAEKCLDAGMDDYISKPFDPKVLYSKIVSAIHNKRPVEKY